MSVRPGPRLLHAAALLTILSLPAFLWGPWIWILLASLPVLAAFCYRDARQAESVLNQLSVTRQLPGTIGRNLLFEDVLRLKNSSSQDIKGALRDVLPHDCMPQWWSSTFQIPAGETRSFVGVCRIPRRGQQTFGPIWLRTIGPAGLMEVQKSLDQFDSVRVLPETFASREELQKDLGASLLLLDKPARARQVGTGTEFVSLFPYRQGDDPRRIDWRATARHRFPIVRQYQIERHRDVLILIDNGRLMGAQTERGTKLDCAVDAALNLSRVALQNGDRCGIGVFDSELRGYLAPLAGPKSLGSLVECVYDLQTQWKETDFTRLFAELQRRQSKRCLLVILSDLSDPETSRMHLAALARLNQRHLLLFAALRTPLLRRILKQETSSVLEGARQTVVLGLQRDRSRALHTLRHGGVHVLDVEPQQLTLPLINQFIELRQRNLL